VEVVSRLGILATRISSFRVGPTIVSVGDPVTATGKLEYYNPAPLIGGWYPLPNRVVKLVINNSVAQETTTREDGGFTFTFYPREIGIYWVKTRYDPSGLDAVMFNPCESSEVAVHVVPPEEKQRRDLMLWGLIAASAVAVAATAVAVITYTSKK
jgi:hypothetical protein